MPIISRRELLSADFLRKQSAVPPRPPPEPSSHHGTNDPESKIDIVNNQSVLHPLDPSVHFRILIRIHRPKNAYDGKPEDRQDDIPEEQSRDCPIALKYGKESEDECGCAGQGGGGHHEDLFGLDASQYTSNTTRSRKSNEVTYPFPISIHVCFPRIIQILSIQSHPRQTKDELQEPQYNVPEVGFLKALEPRLVSPGLSSSTEHRERQSGDESISCSGSRFALPERARVGYGPGQVSLWSWLDFTRFEDLCKLRFLKVSAQVDV